MRYKKIMILSILFVTLLTVSAVSAADNTTSDIVGIEETTDEVVSIENDEEILEENNVGTFTDLAEEIANAQDELNLTRNYTYDREIDQGYYSGIKIDKSIVINGNGFTINGKHEESGLFNITGSNVVLKNNN